MGIPKFFRWLGERYPLVSQVVTPNQIPNFDNFYLDMNGIIHKCSHPDDNKLSHLSEDQIFADIFAYIEHLFNLIQPQKVFFLALDGVAPRAKMNQQRSRRFRTAQENAEKLSKALKKGEKPPKEPPFDSNCITPGTAFMARLTKHLTYFLAKKVSEDCRWRCIQVIFSGHEVPGEGEHKIMAYIRDRKSASLASWTSGAIENNLASGGDVLTMPMHPDTRHCVYGLDADLIMLGLLSHDVHFSLLREEVTFSSNKKASVAQFPKFILLHLSVLREYIALEFIDMIPPAIYNKERVIDDFILISVFIGNDFVPHLPCLHIHSNAFQVLFDAYKAALPRMEGYINDAGVLDVHRLEIFMEELSKFEYEVFLEREGIVAGDNSVGQSLPLTQDKLPDGLTMDERDLYLLLKSFRLSNNLSHSFWNVDGMEDHEVSLDCETMSLPNRFNAKQRHFISNLAEDLGLDVEWSNDRVTFTRRFEDYLSMSLDEVSSVDDSDSESSVSDVILRNAISKYESLPLLTKDTDNDFLTGQKIAEDELFKAHKCSYYKDKLAFDPLTHRMAFQNCILDYVRIVQWILLYYFQGVPSWSYFYPYHYSPFISDLTGLASLIGEGSLAFQEGIPFLPYEQLLSVLPPGSASLVPPVLQPLLLDRESPLAPFYPKEFRTDLNGKKNSWEAVVQIPFLDEKRLVTAVEARIHMLNTEEKEINKFGCSQLFSFVESPQETYAAPSKSFGDILANHCQIIPLIVRKNTSLKFVPLPHPKARVGSSIRSGFPTLSCLPFHVQRLSGAVRVFQFRTKEESLILSVQSRFVKNFSNMVDGGSLSDTVLRELLGRRIWINYPYRTEAVLYSVCDGQSEYYLDNYERNDKIPKRSIMPFPDSYYSCAFDSDDKNSLENQVNSSFILKEWLKSMTLKDRRDTSMKFPTIQRRPLSPAEVEDFRRLCSVQEESILEKTGVCFPAVRNEDSPEVGVWVSVRKFVTLQQNIDGSRVKMFESENQTNKIWIPMSLVLFRGPVDEPDKTERSAFTLEERFPEGEVALYVGPELSGSCSDNKWMLTPCKMVSCKSIDSIVIQLPTNLSMSHTFPINSNARAIRGDIYFLPTCFSDMSFLSRLYVSSSFVCQRLKISAFLLSRISSLFLLSEFGHDKLKPTTSVDIGLDMKFERQALKMLNYTEKVRGQWVYSPKAVALLTDYHTAFPWLFQRLEVLLRANTEKLSVNQVFTGGIEELSSVLEWLKHKKDLEAKDLCIAADELAFNEYAIIDLQSFLNSAPKANVSKKISFDGGVLLNHCSRSFIFGLKLRSQKMFSMRTQREHIDDTHFGVEDEDWSELHGSDHRDIWKVADRVFFVGSDQLILKNGIPPLGSMGTIVRIRASAVGMDVLWDDPFNTDGSRIMKNLPKWTLLNMSILSHRGSTSPSAEKAREHESIKQGVAYPKSLGRQFSSAELKQSRSPSIPKPSGETVPLHMKNAWENVSPSVLLPKGEHIISHSTEELTISLKRLLNVTGAKAGQSAECTSPMPLSAASASTGQPPSEAGLGVHLSTTSVSSANLKNKPFSMFVPRQAQPSSTTSSRRHAA